MARPGGTERHVAKSPGTLSLLAGWALGPLAWALHENIAFVAFRWFCVSGTESVLHLVTLAALAVAGGAGMLAWRNFNRTRGEGTVLARSHFLALIGIMISAISFVGILLESLPHWLVEPCLGVT